MRRCALLVAISLVAPLPAASDAARGTAAPGAPAMPPVEIMPHRAIYSLGLAGTEFGSGIIDASGTMAFEWAESCENWIIQQKAIFDVFAPEGTPARTEVTFTSWESKAGDEMGFSLRTTQDGEVIEDLRGQATLDPGRGGEAVYVRPEPRTVTLPPGTMFSAAHTMMLIARAQAGETSVLLPVFLGQREDEPMTVNAVISPRPVDRDSGTDDRGGLLRGPSWQMHLAFYGAEDPEAPAFEVHESLYANGVVGDATVIYDTFAFAYDLERLEMLPTPEC